MPNLYQQFKELLPETPLLVGTVISVQTGGCVVELPDGSAVFARGTSTVTSKVFVKDGAIQGAAPSLPVEEIEI